jgi:hypothetical protein
VYRLYIANLTIPELKNLCRNRELSTGGNKQNLLQRLGPSFRRDIDGLFRCLKNNQLRRICETNELPITGNKAELIERIRDECSDNLDNHDPNEKYDDSIEDISDSLLEDDPDSEENIISPPEINNYKYLGKIGEGGFGTSYLYLNLNLRRMEVVKFVNQTNNNRVLHEARIQAQINHKNIVKVYSVDKDAPPKIFMEYCSGGSLASRITSLLYPYRDDTGILDVFKGILAGLVQIHNRRIYHCDLGPHNIFLTETNEPKIGDFGISLAPTNIMHTIQNGRIAGRHPNFFPPEGILQNNLSGDIYTLGQIIIACYKGLNSYTIEDIPERLRPETTNILRQMLDENPKKRITTIDLYDLIGKI